MKKVFYFLSFASLFIMFSAFTFVESHTIDLDKVESTEAFVASGKFSGCYIAGFPSIVTYNLVNQAGTIVSGNVDCIGNNITLDQGNWDIRITSSNPAYVVLKWEFCGTPGQFGMYHPGGNAEISFTQFFVSC